MIIPVFNEADTLEELLRQVVEAPYDKQVIVVDDGSTDETSQILAAWEVDGVIQAVSHTSNRGKGAAIRTALPHAIGKFTIIQDGDLELTPAEYPSLIQPLFANDADFVIGSRFLNPIEAPRLFRWGVKMLNTSVHLLYGTRFTDEACCYKAMPTQTLRKMNLQCERFEFCPEVVAKACRMNLRILEVPVEYHPRSLADGKKLRYRDGLQAMLTLWRWRRWNCESQ